MALLIDADGKETAGGIVAVRDAFVAAADGKLVCLDARMSYDHSQGPNAQVLEFSGRWAADGKPFAVKSDPIPPGGALAAQARALARKLIEQSPA
jgi:hypothetical protein